MKKIKNYLSKILTSLRISIFGEAIISATYKGTTLIITWESGSVSKYEGSCTVWHKHPYMHRCSPQAEKFLSNIWSYIQKWGNDYPTAHLNERNNL